MLDGIFAFATRAWCTPKPIVIVGSSPVAANSAGSIGHPYDVSVAPAGHLSKQFVDACLNRFQKKAMCASRMPAASCMHEI